MNQATTQQPTPSLTIRAAQVASFAGTRAEPLYTALAAGMSGASFQATSVYAVGDEEAETAPVLAAPLALQGTTRAQCLTELILHALMPLLSRAGDDSESPPLVSLLLPMDPGRDIRARGIDFQAIHLTLCDALHGLATDNLKLIPRQQGAIAEIIRLRQRLADGEANQAILCGADSLINGLTYRTLANNGTLATENHLDGIVPGEGAAAVLLQLQSARPDTEQLGLGRIIGLASVDEPHAGQAANRPLYGATEALRQATADNPDLLEAVDTVILGHAQGVADDLEWHHVTRQLWPRRLDEQQRVAMMLGEIDAPALREQTSRRRLRLGATAGEIGAATLPMQLALACEQFRHQAYMARFGFSNPQPLLVLENGDYPLRGALALQPPGTET
jgi:3-oxoacyl-[acyl-carrier-protein] synthase-1